jgi:hypothetical protein
MPPPDHPGRHQSSTAHGTSSALLVARSPPRLSRWRWVLPEDAGTDQPHAGQVADLVAQLLRRRDDVVASTQLFTKLAKSCSR